MNKSPQKPRFLAVDFFCGAGGTTRGLISAGGMVVAGIDNDAKCKLTYERNNKNRFGQPKFLNFDVFKRTPEYKEGQQDLLIATLAPMIQAARTKFPDVPLLFSVCAPCQPFARLAKQGVSEARIKKHVRDRSLLLQALRFIKCFSPDLIFSENVASITSSQYGEVWRRFENDLMRLNYSTGSDVVNAVNYGIAQYRKRSILIAVRRHRRSKKKLDVPLADKRRKRTSVKQVIGHLPPLQAGQSHPDFPNHATRNLGEINFRRLQCATPGETNKYLSNTIFGDLSLKCHRKVKSRLGISCFGDVYTRMHPDKPAPTITTRCLSVSNGRFGHYDVKQVRPISIREAALLQSFPESYVFYPTGELETPARMIGNAVPPRLARFFARHLLYVSGNLRTTS